jgi:hypothetical protein
MPISKILAKCLSEKNFTLALSEINNFSFNLIQSVDQILNNQYTDFNDKENKPIKTSHQLLKLLKAKLGGTKLN